MDNQKTINKFRGDFEYLSNFYRQAPFECTSGAVWKTSEHFYQAAKTFHPTYRNNIYMASTPGDAKYLGARAPLREDWHKIKETIMRKALMYKFSQNMDIAKKLVSTDGFMLIEGNTWHDNFWGNCTCCKDRNVHPKPKTCMHGGLNRLGYALVSVRNELMRNGEMLLRIVKES